MLRFGYQQSPFMWGRPSLALMDPSFAWFQRRGIRPRRLAPFATSQKQLYLPKWSTNPLTFYERQIRCAVTVRSETKDATTLTER